MSEEKVDRVRAMKAEELLDAFDEEACGLASGTGGSFDTCAELRAELLSRLSRVEELQQQVAELKAEVTTAKDAILAEQYLREAAEAEAEKAKGERDEARINHIDANERNIAANNRADSLERQLGVMREALLWSLNHLERLVLLTEDGAAYIRGTGTELAGFAAQYHEARAALSPEPAQSTPQIPCPTCGAMMDKAKLPNCGGSHGSAPHAPECYQRETFEQRMQKELSDAGQTKNRKP